MDSVGNKEEFSFVQELIEAILRKGRYKGWAITHIRHHFYSGSYIIDFAYPTARARVQIPYEFIENIRLNADPFMRLKIKRILRKKLIPNTDIDE